MGDTKPLFLCERQCDANTARGNLYRHTTMADRLWSNASEPAQRTHQSAQHVARLEADVVEGLVMHEANRHLQTRGGSMLIDPTQTQLPRLSLNASKSNDLLEYTKKIKKVNKDAEIALTKEGTPPASH